MAKLLKLRRGTTTQHGSFTGAEGEVTIDTTKDTAVVHDGSTQGGTPLAKEDMSNVPAGTILGTQLENSGVTGGQYGSSSAIPIITVDNQGLVTSASTTAIDSTTIANGTSNVAVANNGDITVTRAGGNNSTFNSSGLDVNGSITCKYIISSGALLHECDTNKLVHIENNDEIHLKTNGSVRAKITNAGAQITGNLDVSSGVDVTGNITATGTATTGAIVAKSAQEPQLVVQDSDTGNTGNAAETSIQYRDGGATVQGQIGFHSSSNKNLYIDTQDSTNSPILMRVGASSTQFKVDNTGVDVTGNITVSGTVDGVDIAALKTSKDSLSTTNGALVNGVVATTQSASDTSTKVATTAYVKAAITGYNFPSGTKMLFQQTSAPTGWTKITSGVNNKALRVVSGSAGSGGNIAFTTVFANRGITANAGNTTQGGNVSVANSTQGGNISVANSTAGGNISVANASTGGTVNSHTLSVNEMPSHSHSYGRASAGNGPICLSWESGARIASNTSGNTSNTGGGGGHSHGFTGGSHNHNASFSGSAHNHNATFSGSAHNHNATFSGSAHNHSISVSNLDMQAEYLDVIIASKD